LGTFGGGPGTGIWRIPPEGAEVVVMISQGELSEQSVIIGTLSTGDTPSTLDADTFVLINPKRVHIESKDDKCEIKAHGQVTIDSTNDDIVLNGGSHKVARVSAGDKTEAHGHDQTEFVFSLTAGPYTVSGTIATAVNSHAGLEITQGGASHVKA
jgi:hypothetical protein